MGHHFFVQFILEDETAYATTILEILKTLFADNIDCIVSIIYRDKYLQILEKHPNVDLMPVENITKQLHIDDSIDMGRILNFVSENLSEQGRIEIRYKTHRKNISETTTQIAEFSFTGKDVTPHNLSTESLDMLYHRTPYQVGEQHNILTIDFGEYSVYSIASSGDTAKTNIEQIVTEILELLNNNIKTIIGKLDQNTETSPDDWTLIYHKNPNEFLTDLEVLGYGLFVNTLTGEQIQNVVPHIKTVGIRLSNIGGVMIFDKFDFSGNTRNFYKALRDYVDSK